MSHVFLSVRYPHKGGAKALYLRAFRDPKNSTYNVRTQPPTLLQKPMNKQDVWQTVNSTKHLLHVVTHIEEG